MKKNGISLITLIVSIIIIIILATVAILAFTNNNPIKSAKKAVFVNDIDSFKSQLQIYISKKMLENSGKYDVNLLNVGSEYFYENGLRDDSKNILNVIDSLKGTEYESSFEIIEGKLVYVGSKEDEVTWAKDIGTNVEIKPFNKRLDSKVILGYWENWVSGEPNTPAIKLSQIPNYYDVIALTFGYTKTGMQNGEIDFCLNEYLSTYLSYSEDEFKQDIINTQNKGTKVILSIGGEGKNIVITNDTEVDNFVNTVSSIIDEYGLNGIDLDLEASINVNVEYFEKAIRKLHTKYNNNLLITMSSSLTSMIEDGMDGADNNYNYKLSLNMKDILDLVSNRYYNSGTKSGYDFPNPWSREQGHISFITSLATIQLERILNQNQVAIGIVSGEEKASNGGVLPPAYLSPDDMIKLFNSLIKGEDPLETYRPFVPPNLYPNIGGVVIWSINNDCAKNYQMTLKFREYFKSLK